MVKPKRSTKAERKASKQVESFRSNLDSRLKGDYGAATDLAERAGLHPVYICRLAKGNQKPGLEVALRVAAALGTPIQEML